MITTLFGKFFSNNGGKTYNSITDYMGGLNVRFSQSKIWVPTNGFVQSSDDNGASWTTTILHE